MPEMARGTANSYVISCYAELVLTRVAVGGAYCLFSV
jgi:hypothetical protein